MPSPRKLIGAAAFSLALAGGGLAGALLGTPGTSGAQDSTTTTAPATADAAPDGTRPMGPRHGHPGMRLDAAAEVIGITPAELLTELKAGKSIAQVAQAHDVDPQKVIDALVAKGTARLEDAIKALPDQVTTAVNREGLPARPDGPRGPHHNGDQDGAATDDAGAAANS
jgi:hypothetical protein